LLISCAKFRFFEKALTFRLGICI